MLRNYLKVALKVLGRRKFFTFISLFGISVTLVVLMVATALLDQVFTPEAPEVHGDRTLGIYQIGLRSEQIAYTGFDGYGLLDRVLRNITTEVPAVGRTIAIDGQTFRVVGVVKDVPVLRVVAFSDVWVPISTFKSSTYRKDYIGNFMAILLARSRADFPAIQSEVATRLKAAEAGIPNPEMYKWIFGG